MSDCTLTEESPGRWICLECDPSGDLALPADLPRNCRAKPRPDLLTMLLAELDRADHFTWGPDRLDDVEIRSRLAACIACEEFTGSHCGRDRPGCAGRKAWLLRVTCSNPPGCEWW